LRAKGYDEVYQLQGGVHRYLEAFEGEGSGDSGDSGASGGGDEDDKDKGNGAKQSLFKGKNFVFDSRVAVPSVAPSTSTTKTPVIVGTCLDCACPHDEYSGAVVCTVCRMPVLVCPKCCSSNPNPHEYYCIRHRYLKGIYFTVLNFSIEELQAQSATLYQLEDATKGIKKMQGRRKTLRKQREKIAERIDFLQLGGDKTEVGTTKGSLTASRTKENFGFWAK